MNLIKLRDDKDRGQKPVSLTQFQMVKETCKAFTDKQ